MRESPTYASSLGDHRWDALWDDASLEAIARREKGDRDALARLRAIPRGALSREDALSYDLFARKYGLAVEGQPFRTYLLAINQRSGVQTADDLADSMPFETAKHYDDWTARLRALPAYVDQTIALLREGVAAHIVHPKVVMARLPGQLDKQIVDDPTKSPFYAPYKKIPKTFSEADRARITKEADAAVREAVVPAFRKLKAYFVASYLPACSGGVGVWQIPRGDEVYAHEVRHHTTTSLSPREVHDIGLAEVARIRAEMEKVKARAGFKGSLAELSKFLRTDKRFFYKSGAELLAAYRDMSKRIDPLLVKLFGTLPRMPYGVAAIPDNVAPDTTTAYYREPAADGSRAGTYFVNLYKPETRPKWEMPALSLHESVPGHHLQIAIAMEHKDLPAFRRYEYLTAYAEGWALYAESLGEEMGLYDDPYDKLGQLNYEMWRAVRLVVDTGIHHLKWDRQRAIDFFLENTARSPLDVTNEVDRYIVWPGQALAYKMGELRIKQLRADLTKELGARFDLRAFHDAVLRSGALPLDVLEAHVRAELTAPAK